LRKPIQNIPKELVRDIDVCVEVVFSWGIEWEGRVRGTAVIPAIGLYAAHSPEGPARDGWCPWNAARVGLEKVDLVQWSAVAGAAQQRKEDQ